MRFAPLVLLALLVALSACDSRGGLDGSTFSLTVEVETRGGDRVPGLSAAIETLFMAPEAAAKGGDAFLLNTYPSPFREQGAVGVGVSRATAAKIEVLAIDSTVISTLVDDTLRTGGYVFPIQGDAFPGGAYLLRAKVGQRVLNEWLLATDGPTSQTDRIRRDLGPLGDRGRATFRDRRIAPVLYGYPASFVLINDASTRTGRVSLSPEVVIAVTDGARTERQRLRLVDGPNEITITW